MTRNFCELLKMVPVAMVMGTIFFLSHHTSDDGIRLPDFPYIDLVAHMFIYGLLGVTILYAWGDLKRTYPLKAVLFTVIVCLLYGISDEFHQSFIPGRYATAIDVGADTFGGLLVCTIWWFTSKKPLFTKSYPE